jgi:hypothetical protein
MASKRWSATSLVAIGALGMGSAGLALIGTGVAVAGSTGKTIHSCVSRSSGRLRIVTSTKHCTSHERALSFNERGPRGLRGLQGTPGKNATSSTFQMFANVDQHGNLGSNSGAVSAKEVDAGTPTPSYVVTFSHPIGSCAAVAQNGYAGGDLPASGYPTRVTNDPKDADAVDVAINEEAMASEEVEQAFMIVVTCAS